MSLIGIDLSYRYDKSTADHLDGGSDECMHAQMGDSFGIAGSTGQSECTSSQRYAIRKVDLVIEPGSAVGLVGCSGSGKTTLLRCLAGLMGDVEGTAFLSEQQGRCDIFETCWHRYVGYVSQSSNHLLFKETVFDEVAFALCNMGKAKDIIDAAVTRALGEVGLDLEWARSTSPATCSQGEAKLVALACALVLEPAYLLLDEPSVGLDARGVSHLEMALERYCGRGGGLLVASHDARFLSRACSKIIALSQGRVIAEGSVAKILADDSIARRAGYVVPDLYRIVKMIAPKGGEDAFDNVAYSDLKDAIAHWASLEEASR